MFLPPTRRQSILRSLTNPTNRSIRFAALLAIVALGGTVLATTNSSASALGRMLYARAATVIAGGATASETKAAHHDHAFATRGCGKLNAWLPRAARTRPRVWQTVAC